MKQHVMLDLETLNITPDGVILSIGAVKFDPYGLQDPEHGLYLRLDVDEQIALGRTVDDKTIQWWSTQPEDVRDEAFTDFDRVGLQEFYAQFNKFVSNAECVWAQGTVFDIGMIENLYRQMGWPAPWNFWQICDSRTLFKVFGEQRQKHKETLHNPFMDAYNQAKAVQQVYKIFDIKENANNFQSRGG